jgi:cytidine deaminase
VPTALTADDVELIARATAVIAEVGETEREIHTVGAAVRDSRGQIFVGVNLYHFTGGPCAELVALGAARAGGASDIATIVAVGSGGRGVMAPCGRDRQVFVDYYPEVRVIVPTEEGPLVFSTEELLPFSYHQPTEG